MLRDPKMFKIPDNEIGMKISNLVVYSIPFTIITLLFTSYSFEIFGRKWTLFFSYFFTSVLYFWMPRTAPDYKMLMFVRCLIAITMAAPLAHPLVADYVHINSRGKMITLCGMGIVVGEISAISIFKVQTVYKQDFYQSFNQLSMLVFGFSIYFLIVIKDPSL
jgi:predicted MFS family arabinose efflux permease